MWPRRPYVYDCEFSWEKGQDSASNWVEGSQGSTLKTYAVLSPVLEESFILFETDCSWTLGLGPQLCK
eukprot:5263488-Amphidinium_carterae.1